MTSRDVDVLQEGIFRIRGKSRGSHSYVVRGSRGNMLIDSGLDSNFQYLKESLHVIGMKVRDIDIVVNTHEHFDHIGANRYFQEHAIIAAHRFAANKMAFDDRYVTLYKSGDANEISLHVHLWLESRSRLDLGDFTFDVIHTPGHTSGSICIYDPARKILFTGDTLFAGGVIPVIAESGSTGDYINSLKSLQTRFISEIYPGHGEISTDPGDDIHSAIDNAFKLLNGEESVRSKL
ncbi:MAG TPA: MBL fold metallo-hydrolase [Spirochaetota bacterium]|nr:MBL fold metallo-hydrolase [Spirochaetota bacterium]